MVNGHTIKELLDCYVVWLGSMMGLRTYTRCAGLVPCFGQDGYRAQVQQHPIET